MPENKPGTFTKDSKISAAVVGCTLLGLFSFHNIFIAPELEVINQNVVKIAVLESDKEDLIAQMESQKNEFRNEITRMQSRQDEYHDNVVTIINSLAEIKGQLKQICKRR